MAGKSVVKEAKTIAYYCTQGFFLSYVTYGRNVYHFVVGIRKAGVGGWG